MRWAGLILVALAGCAVEAPAPDLPPPSPPPPMTAGDYYKWAESLFQLGDFDRSLLQCENALRCDPRHAGATALQTEVAFVLGKGRHQAEAQLRVLESLLEEGRMNLFFGNLDYAQDCAERAFGIAQRLPPEMDVDLRIAQVKAILDWARTIQEDEEQ
jgi:hypothetical protein